MQSLQHRPSHQDAAKPLDPSCKERANSSEHGVEIFVLLAEPSRDDVPENRALRRG